MGDPQGPGRAVSQLESELYFLIAHFLSSGPCRKSAEMLIQELNEYQMFPKRRDWLGNEHPRTFEDFISLNKHIAPDHLLQICQYMSSLLSEDPAIKNLKGGSLLCSRKLSSLRTGKGYTQILDPINVEWSKETFATLCRGRPPEIPVNCRRPLNVVEVHHGKHLTGAVRFNSVCPINLYQKIKMHRRILGHLSSVYCVTFDRTGQRIFTGSDDCLVKIWSSYDGRLLATLRGPSAEISDITVNHENTLIAAGCCEKYIRVWCLRTCSPVAVLLGHTDSVTSLVFSPLVKGSLRYLISTGSDSSVCFWQWDVDTLEFNNRPLKFIERSGLGAKMVCCSCSAGGMLVATGSTDGAIRMYYLGYETPEKMSELEGHTDTVDSIQFSNHGERFVSGSADGTARIWYCKQQEWKSILLDKATRLDGRLRVDDEERLMNRPVLTIAWDCLDSIVVTAHKDQLIKVWDSLTGKLLRIMKGHLNETYILEPHPFDSRIMLSAGYDGNIFIWDITNGTKINQYSNMIEGQGFGAIFDCKLSADGQHLACTDSHGHLLIMGFGSGKPYEKIPDEMFFHTDYRPLCRDENGFVLDEQTQQAPHLMPPPFLVDVDGNPHPTIFQRLVPGREKCADEHLIPQLGYVETSDGEVVEQIIGQRNFDRNLLDGIIRQLQQQQDQRQDPGPSRPSQVPDAQRRDLVSPPNIALRRSGPVEGVRQMHHNSPRSQIATEWDLQASKRRVIVPEVSASYNRQQEKYRIAKGEEERALFLIIPRRGRLCDSPEEDTIPAIVLSSDGSGNEEEWTNENNSFSDSCSEYSDWTTDAGINLQPPSRTSTRRRVQRLASTSEDESSSEEKSPKKRCPKPSNPKGEARSPRRPPVDRASSNDWRPPVWITDTTPRKSPFVPQMGDEVIYFRQGHEAYINAVRRNNTDPLNLLKEPWKKIVLRDQELVKIVGIRYEVGPPTLCCLKLTLIDHVSGKLTDQSFSLKYHDMPDVIDFLILRQSFDHAREKNWQTGDKFRSIIDDAWWFGTVLSQEPYQADYPDSLFQSYTVKWDNTEIERLSPWDMDIIPEGVIQPEEPGTSVSLSQDELDNLLYRPQDGEWGNRSRDEECERIICGIDQLLNLDMANDFATPVDWRTYRNYYMMVAYPTDLGTIRMRLVNRFYRRISALVWEVRYIEHNAKTYNETDSGITRSAKRITNLLLKFIMDSDCTNITDLCNTTDGNLEKSYDEQDNEDTEGPRTSSGFELQKKSSSSSVEYKEDAWQRRCVDVVNFIIECKDSDYTDLINTPMDLETVKKQLQEGHYFTPLDLLEDVELIFYTAKVSIPNKSSKTYSVVVKLSALFEKKMKVIIADYDAAEKSKKTLGKNSLPYSTNCILQSPTENESEPEQSSLQPTSNKLNNISGQTNGAPTLGGASLTELPGTFVRKKMDYSTRRFPDFPDTEMEDRGPASSTSDSKHSSNSSSSSSSEEAESNHKSDSDSGTPRMNGFKKAKKSAKKSSKKSGQRQKKSSPTKQAFQGSSRKSNSSKRRCITDSDDSLSPNKASEDTSRKKMLRKSAALAANKIKCMSDVEDGLSTSDSDCSASKNSRTLPHRTAAAEAKKRILGESEEENGFSDSEQEVKMKQVAKNRNSLAAKTVCKSDVSNGLICSDSDYSVSPCPATAEARRSLLDDSEEENGLKSDSDEGSLKQVAKKRPLKQKNGGANKLSTSDSDSPCKSRLLPHRAAAVEASKHLVGDSERESVLNDIEKQLKMNAVAMNPYVLMPPNVVIKSDSSSCSSDSSLNSPSPNPPAEHNLSEGEASNDEELDQIVDEHSLSDASCQPPPTTSQVFNSDSESETSSSISDVKELNKKWSSHRKYLANKSNVSPMRRKLHPLTSYSEHIKNTCRNKKSTAPPCKAHKSVLKTDSESDSDVKTKNVHKRAVSPIDSPPAKKASVYSDSEDTSDSGKEDGSYCACSSTSEKEVSRSKSLKNLDCSDSDSSESDSSSNSRKKMNGKGKGARPKTIRQKRKRSKSSCDEDWEEKEYGKRKKLSRRTKIRTRNQGKRTVQYKDEDGDNIAHSDENLGQGFSRDDRLRKVAKAKAAARQFLL
ncbi:bromodomain and WD repeat-containing protein 1 [Discoglossus pictus]